MKKRLICLILLAATLLTMCQPVFAAGIGREPAPAFKSDLKDTLRAEKIALLTESLIRSEDAKIRISAIRRLQDFAGNEYTLIECEPTGYYILHNASGRYVEYAAESVSPYREVKGEIYYAGPTWYFEEDGTEYTDVMEQTVISLDSPEQRQAMTAFCNEIHHNLVRDKQADVVAYLSDEGISASGSSLAAVCSGRDEAQSTVVSYVGQYTLLKKMKTENQIGYYAEGKKGFCGYVAANIILRYWQKRGQLALPSYYVNYPKRLTADLILIGKKLGYDNAIRASKQAKVLQEFCKKHKIYAESTTEYYVSKAITEIKTKKRPCVISATLPMVDREGHPYRSHAVIAYGYEEGSAGDRYILHYGWPGYSFVKIDKGCISGSPFVDSVLRFCPPPFKF